MLEAAGSYFDGSSAAKHKVTVRLDEAARLLSFDGDSLHEPEVWPLDELRLLADQPTGGWLTFTRHVPGGDEMLVHEARLSLKDGAMNAALRAVAPRLHKRDVHKGTGLRIIKTLGAAAVAVVLMLFVILPAMADTLARFMPREREVQFGKAVVSQMTWFLAGDYTADLTCKDEAGLAALAKMTERLTGNVEMEYDLDIKVFDHPMVNAFAAPGGQIVIMRGLIDDADGPDAVAGVLAHEIGHVEHRDATRGALRAAGSAGLISMVLGDFTGGAAAVVIAEQLLETSYTRDAEAKADDFALKALGSAQVSGEGFASFFEQIAEMEGAMPDLPGYLLSHPPSDERRDKARDFAGRQGDVSPVLDEAEWKALQAVCDSEG